MSKDEEVINVERAVSSAWSKDGFGDMSEIGSTWNGILKKEGKPGIMLALSTARGKLCFVLFYHPQRLPHGNSSSCVLFCTLIPCPAARSDLEAATFLADTCIKAGIKAGRYCKSHGLCVCLCVWFMTVSRISTPGKQRTSNKLRAICESQVLLQHRYPNVTQPSRDAILHRTSWQRNSNQRGSWVSGN